MGREAEMNMNIPILWVNKSRRRELKVPLKICSWKVVSLGAEPRPSDPRWTRPVDQVLGR